MRWPRWVLGLAVVPLGIGTEVVAGQWGTPLGTLDLVVGVSFGWLGLIVWGPRGYLAAAVYPVGHDPWVSAGLCAAVLATVLAGHLRSSGPERRVRAVGLAGTVAITLVLG